jgi:hypothetical protein
MPSVEVVWKGRCVDANARRFLSEKMKELGALSHSFFAVPPPVKVYDQTLSGRILIGASLLNEAPTSPALVRVGAGQLLSNQLSGGISLELAGPMREPVVSVAEDLFALHQARLYGVEFRLYDGRGFYLDDDRISFVFLTAEDCPELDGAVVYVEDRARCQQADHELVRQADWYLTAPHIHLRYYCEEWMDMLLAWVKCFSLPELEYWRYQYLSGYAEFTAACGDMPREIAFAGLQEMLRKEVEGWVATAAEARNFWATIQLP